MFERNLQAHDQPLVSWQAYTVKRRDLPENIAAKHGLSLAQLKEVNGITGKKKIAAGQTILVPLKGTAEPHLPDLPAPKVTLPRYRPQKSRCVQVKTKSGKQQMQCRAPAKKSPAAAKSQAAQPAKQRVNVSFSARQ